MPGIDCMLLWQTMERWNGGWLLLPSITAYGTASRHPYILNPNSQMLPSCLILRSLKGKEEYTNRQQADVLPILRTESACAILSVNFPLTEHYVEIRSRSASSLETSKFYLYSEIYRQWQFKKSVLLRRSNFCSDFCLQTDKPLPINQLRWGCFPHVWCSPCRNYV